MEMWEEGWGFLVTVYIYILDCQLRAWGAYRLLGSWLGSLERVCSDGSLPVL